jgi:hypothetical protein
MARRKRPSLTEKLAAALLHLPQIGPDCRPILDGMGRLVPMFTIDEVRALTAAQFASLFEFDHAIYATWLGEGRHPWWNYTPRLIVPHREKTRKDAGEISRVRRGTKKRAAQQSQSESIKVKPVGLGGRRPPGDASRPSRGGGSPAPYQRLMQYTAMKASHKRDMRTGKVTRRTAP